MARCRIVYVAPFEHDYGTEFHVARDAEAIGCTVTRVPERDGLHKIHKVAFDCEVLLYTKGGGLPDDATQLWRDVESVGVITASHTLDLFHGLRRETEVGQNPFWTVDTVFSADGGTPVEWWWERGVDHRWSPPAIVSDEAIDVDLDGAGLADVIGAEIVFVGSSMAYHHEHHWRIEMLGALARRYGTKFATFGPHSGVVVRGLDLNRLYQRPGRIVVGDSLALPGHRDYFSDRYFETVGRGGFLIGPRVPGLDAFLTEGEHFVGYDQGDIDQLCDRIDFWLDAPDKAREIARAGQAHVRDHHTYRHRVASMLDVLGL